MPEIGHVERVPLHIHRGGDLVFEFQWWGDEEETIEVPLASAEGKVGINADEVLLDLADYCTVLNNKVSVYVPAELTIGLPVMPRGIWDFFVTTVAGERRPVARGPARIHRKVGDG